MRRLLSAMAILAASLLLASCGLLPSGGPLIFDDSHRKADARMEQIADALNDRDAAALKEMFSTYALEKATGIDDGLDYLLSFFPNGGISWEGNTVDSEGHTSSGKKSEVLFAFYKVSAEGNDFWLFFADFTVNEVENPDNVGVYALGVTPWTEDLHSGEAEPFFDWAGGIHLKEDGPNGYPGVYVPE